MTDAASETRGGFPDVRPVEDAPEELDRFVAALRRLQDLTVSTRPDSALWTAAAEHVEKARRLLTLAEAVAPAPLRVRVMVGLPYWLKCK